MENSGMMFLANLLGNAGKFNPAQSIINQMRMAGQPRVSQTTGKSVVTEPQEPIDIGNIGLILLMLFGPGGILQQNKTGAGGAATANPFSSLFSLAQRPGTNPYSSGFSLAR